MDALTFGFVILFFGILSLLIIRSILTVSLYDFEIEHDNPFNVCAALNKYLFPELIIQSSLGFLSLLLSIKKFTFWLFLNAILLLLPSLYSYYLHLNHKLKYDARRIFRDLQTHKINSIIRIVLISTSLFISVILLVSYLVN